MAKKYYTVQNRSEEAADILIYGVIGDSWFEESVTARQFIADLKALEKDHSRINIRINSPGGSVWDGIPIFNAIRDSSSEIHTYNDGLCASMAAVILLAGKTVHAADNSLMMMHSPISGVYGNAGDFEQVLNMLNKVQDSLISCISSRPITKTADEIKSMYFDFKDHWLTADEAAEENFVDVIEKGTRKVSDKIKDLNHDQVIDQFDKLVKGRSLFDRFFSQAHDFFTPNQVIDMDIKKLIDACGLSEDATEQDVLDWIAEHGTSEAEEQAEDVANETTEEAEDVAEEVAAEAETTAEDAAETTDAKDQEIANLKAQVEALKTAPGAKNKSIPKSTDSKGVSHSRNALSTEDIELFNKINQ